MKPLAILLLAISIALTALSALRAPGQAEASLVLGGKIPSGYRDWKLISWPTKKATSTICGRSRQ